MVRFSGVISTTSFGRAFPVPRKLVESWIIPPISMKSGQFGQRIPCLTRPNAVNTSYGYDGDNLIEETNSNGAVITRYTQSGNFDERLAMLRGGATSFYQADGRGSVTSLSNAAGSRYPRKTGKREVSDVYSRCVHPQASCFDLSSTSFMVVRRSWNSSWRFAEVAKYPRGSVV